MQMSRQESRSSAGPDHVTVQALITWLIKSYKLNWEPGYFYILILGFKTILFITFKFLDFVLAKLEHCLVFWILISKII